MLALVAIALLGTKQVRGGGVRGAAAGALVPLDEFASGAAISAADGPPPPPPPPRAPAPNYTMPSLVPSGGVIGLATGGVGVIVIGLAGGLG